MNVANDWAISSQYTTREHGWGCYFMHVAVIRYFSELMFRFGTAYGTDRQKDRENRVDMTSVGLSHDNLQRHSWPIHMNQHSFSDIWIISSKNYVGKVPHSLRCGISVRILLPPFEWQPF